MQFREITAIQTRAHRHHAKGREFQVKLDLGSILSSSAGVVLLIKLEPFDLVRRHMNEMKSFQFGEIVLSEDFCCRAGDAAMTNDDIGNEPVWKFWLACQGLPIRLTGSMRRLN